MPFFLHKASFSIFLHFGIVHKRRNHISGASLIEYKQERSTQEPAMSAKTKIWVFHMKELIYTALFVVLGIVFLLLLIFMFTGEEQTETAQELPSKYTAGIYTASMTLGGNPVEIAVTVDEDYISSIGFRQLDETVAAMYPLMEPALESLAAQICETQSLENLSYSEDSQYTSLMLMNAIETAVSKAKN